MRDCVRGYVRHKVMTVGSLFGITYYILQLPMHPITDVQTGIAGLSYLVILLLLPLYPVVCATAMCVLSVGTSLIPVMFNGPDEYAGVWFAIGVLGFMGTPVRVIVCMLGTMLATSMELVLHFWDKSGVISALLAIDATYLIASVLGLGVRKWGERQSQIATQQAAYERQKEQLRLLHSAHDSIAGKLAGALMLCRLHGDDAGRGDAGTGDAKDWATVALLLQQSLNELRGNIIDPIKVDVGRPPDSVPIGGMTELEFHNVVSEIEAMMGMLGFQGSITVRGLAGHVPADKLSTCADVLHEIHTNIIRHGARHYATMVVFGDDAIVRIISSNPVIAADNGAGDDGLGLALIRRSVERYDGSVRYAVGDGEWNIDVVF